MGETCSHVEEISEKMAVVAIPTWMEGIREAQEGATQASGAHDVHELSI